MWNRSSALRTTGGALGITVLAACAVLAPTLLAPKTSSIHAQNLNASDVTAPDNAKLILAADDLIYDRDRDIVIATGGVQVDYGSYKLVTERIEYDQTTGRVKAIGNIELIEPNGNRIYADELDVTDNFSDGFIQSLRIERPDNTRIAASSAERVNGEVSVFNNGVYTACPTCKENPEKPPLWQIKAARVISNGESNTIRFERPTFEIRGIPIMRLPSFTIPGHETARRSGFLSPTFSYNIDLGYSTSIPYYFALAPNMDATVTASGFSKAGFLAEAEFRQKFRKGSHNLRLAGAFQTNPGIFDANAGHATTDGTSTTRGLIASKAEFELNSKWTLGWDAMLQSDSNFGATYNIDGYKSSRQKSEVYLTGLGTPSYFDLHGYKFDIQGDVIGSTLEDQQAIVYPVIDYHRIFSNGENSGDLKLTFNAQNISRGTQALNSGRIEGVDGHTGRVTTELEWKKQVVTDGGLVLTPLLAGRGDFHSFNVDTATAGLASGSSAARGMITAGLEAKYPILIATENASHVIEPIGQLFVRNDERLSGGLPNEDAQSFVFYASNLFERDKFSGFDRVEGGTRANLGIRYNGSFSNGFSTTAIFGQSFHLAGQNSFAQTDISGAGADSGLETARSDYVGATTINTGTGLSLTAAGRFDKDNFAIQRSTIAASYSTKKLTASLSHSKIKAQTGYGSTSDREEIKGAASLKFANDWRVFGSTTYDIDSSNFTKSIAGLSYEDLCYIVTGVYNHTHATATADASWEVGLRMSFRTLGTIDAGGSPTGRSF
jgi:LPS-assembly protein